MKSLRRFFRALPEFIRLWGARYDHPDIPPRYRHRPARVPARTAWRYVWHYAE